MLKRYAKANVNPIRQRTQFSCVATSTCMALNALGVKCTEDQVNEVIGAAPLRGARWEEVLACCQYFGCRATLTTPATLTQVKAWTDAGKPVLMAWNPEGREWSHASLIFDVTGEKGSYEVHIADPNIPNPDKTVRVVGEDEFYGKWFEKLSNYLVRRPALMIEREVDEGGRQIMASLSRRRKTASLILPKNTWIAANASDLSESQKSRVWELFEQTYGAIGMHVNSQNDLLTKYPHLFILDNDDNPDINAFIAMSATRFGYKLSALGHDGTSPSKRAIITKHIDLLTTRGYYAALSEDMERVVRRGGLDNVKDPYVIRAIFGQDVELVGDGYYMKDVGGVGRKRKAIFGMPTT